MIYNEPNIEERIKKAKEKARLVFNNDGSDITVEEFEFFLRCFIAGYYNIPIFSDYFNERTLDELVLESEIIKLRNTKHEDIVKEKMNSKEAKEELEGLFDDWDNFAKEKPEKADKENKWKDVATDFFNTGKFEGE